MCLSFFFFFFLAILSYKPSRFRSFLDCTLCPYRADQCKSFRVKQVWGVDIHCRTLLPNTFLVSSVGWYVLFILLGWLVRWKARGRKAIFCATYWTPSKYHVTFPCSPFKLFLQVLRSCSGGASIQNCRQDHFSYILFYDYHLKEIDSANIVKNGFVVK